MTDPEDALRAFREGLAGEHLTYETMARFVDGSAPAAERAQVETHIALCASCADEVEDLARFHDQRPRAASSTRWWWLAAAAMLVAIAVALVIATRRTPVTPPAVPPVATKTVPPPAPPTPAPEPVRAEDRVAPELRPVLAALRARQLPAAAILAQLPRVTGEQRSGSDPSHAVHALTPAGVVLDEPRPHFRWTASEPMRVEVFDDSFRLVAASAEAVSGQWRPEQPLARDRFYTWQLTRDGTPRAVFPAPPAPPARFRVISAAASRALQAASGLDRALLLAREGMMGEATAELERLAESHPDEPLYRELVAVTRGQPSPITPNAPQ
ncbi:MAG TPA: zf-HC2 domain-containing protein [Thermoanaerobaculia bacterium]